MYTPAGRFAVKASRGVKGGIDRRPCVICDEIIIHQLVANVCTSQMYKPVSVEPWIQYGGRKRKRLHTAQPCPHISPCPATFSSAITWRISTTRKAPFACDILRKARSHDYASSGQPRRLNPGTTDRLVLCECWWVNTRSVCMSY